MTRRLCIHLRFDAGKVFNGDLRAAHRHIDFDDLCGGDAPLPRVVLAHRHAQRIGCVNDDCEISVIDAAGCGTAAGMLAERARRQNERAQQRGSKVKDDGQFWLEELTR